MKSPSKRMENMIPNVISSWRTDIRTDANAFFSCSVVDHVTIDNMPSLEHKTSQACVHLRALRYGGLNVHVGIWLCTHVPILNQIFEASDGLTAAKGAPCYLWRLPRARFSNLRNGWGESRLSAVLYLYKSSFGVWMDEQKFSPFSMEISILTYSAPPRSHTQDMGTEDRYCPRTGCYSLLLPTAPLDNPLILSRQIALVI